MSLSACADLNVDAVRRNCYFHVLVDDSCVSEPPGESRRFTLKNRSDICVAR